MRQHKNGQPYKGYRDNAPHQQTGNINERNNNVSFNDADASDEQTIEKANESGIGDAGWNDEKLSKDQNHASDA